MNQFVSMHLDTQEMNPESLATLCREVHKGGGVLIAYQPWMNYFRPAEIMMYQLIIRDQRNSRYPYHLGLTGYDPSRFLYDAIERKEQLAQPNWWSLLDHIEDRSTMQCRHWVWLNDDHQAQFRAWHRGYFATWSKKAWESANKLRRTWSPEFKEA